jgi:hypothetical protein
MRKRQLKWLWARLAKLAHMDLSRESLLMKLGAARAKAPAAWRLLDIAVITRSRRLRQPGIRRRERLVPEGLAGSSAAARAGPEAFNELT